MFSVFIFIILLEPIHIHGVIAGIVGPCVGDCSRGHLHGFLSISITILIPAHHQNQ